MNFAVDVDIDFIVDEDVGVEVHVDVNVDLDGRADCKISLFFSHITRVAIFIHVAL